MSVLEKRPAAGSYPDELCQGVVDERSAGQKEAAAGAQVMEEEQLLILEKETGLLSNQKHQQENQ